MARAQRQRTSASLTRPLPPALDPLRAARTALRHATSLLLKQRLRADERLARATLVSPLHYGASPLHSYTTRALPTPFPPPRVPVLASLVLPSLSTSVLGDSNGIIQSARVAIQSAHLATCAHIRRISPAEKIAGVWRARVPMPNTPSPSTPRRPLDMSFSSSSSPSLLCTQLVGRRRSRLVDDAADSERRVRSRTLNRTLYVPGTSDCYM